MTTRKPPRPTACRAPTALRSRHTSERRRDRGPWVVRSFGGRPRTGVYRDPAGLGCRAFDAPLGTVVAIAAEHASVGTGEDDAQTMTAADQRRHREHRKFNPRHITRNHRLRILAQITLGRRRLRIRKLAC